MLKKIFLSPFFMPVSFLVLWLAFMGVIYFGFPAEVLRLTTEGELIEIFTHLGYLVLIAVLLVVADDYRDNIKSWGIYLFLALCALLREQGIQHHLSKTDTTPFKSRFFLNPNNPLGEKIVFGFMLLVVAGAVLYLAIKYSKHLLQSFFKLNTVTWSIAVLCTVGVCAKIIDRFPSNWRKAHNGVPLSDEVYTICQLLEESSEMFLPYIATLILWQYHLLKKK
ncbi:MAG: hypothetical protein NC218_12760 [Acetobacter sp.]|nr:hypothetical protein [Acetobacter sp.]